MSHRIRLTGDRRRGRVAGGALAAAALAAAAIASAGASAADEPVTAESPATVDRIATPDGTPNKGTRAPEKPDLGTILPSAEFEQASFEAAGVGLRNQPQGEITINGVKGRPIKTFVYWAEITNADSSPGSRLSIARTSPPNPIASVTVVGTPVGQGPSPCWGGDRLTVYRGTIPSFVARGNGTYTIKPRRRGSSIKGESPWPGLLDPPYLEGASLVMVYPADDSSVSVFDGAVDGVPGLSGKMFFGTSNHVLERNVRSQGGPALFAEIGADGQTGGGHDGFAAGEVTRLNGVDIAGGKSGKGSDWDGDDGNPLPQLWDTHIHDVTGVLGAKSVKVEVEAGSDCLTHIANVIAG